MEQTETGSVWGLAIAMGAGLVATVVGGVACLHTYYRRTRFAHPPPPGPGGPARFAQPPYKAPPVVVMHPDNYMCLACECTSWDRLRAL